jgi:hypothetical protein
VHFEGFRRLPMTCHRIRDDVEEYTASSLHFSEVRRWAPLAILHGRMGGSAGVAELSTGLKELVDNLVQPFIN